MRSLTWVYCAALLSGLCTSLSPVAGQENWRLPPTTRELWLVSGETPLPPTPDELKKEHQAKPPGESPPWVTDDPGIGGFGAPTKDEPLQSPTCGTDEIQYECCPPRWLVRGEALLWNRTNPTAQVLGVGTNTVASGDLDFGWRAGPRITLQRQNIFNSNWGVELAYFGIDGWNATAVVTDINSIPTLPSIFIGGAVPGNITYGSRLYSSEINFRRDLTERLTFVNGFRWVEFGENLRTDIAVPAIATLNANVNNHLYGYQLGFDYRFWTPSSRWFADAVVKAGIYSNTADSAITTTGIGGALPLTSAASTRLAFLGEAGLYGGYRITNSWRVIGGYSVLWLSGVADAAGQYPSANIATGAATVDTTASPFYHGATMGLEWVH